MNYGYLLKIHKLALGGKKIMTPFKWVTSLTPTLESSHWKDAAALSN